MQAKSQTLSVSGLFAQAQIQAHPNLMDYGSSCLGMTPSQTCGLLITILCTPIHSYIIQGNT